jgi:hypothetical protein
MQEPISRETPPGLPSGLKGLAESGLLYSDRGEEEGSVLTPSGVITRQANGLLVCGAETPNYSFLLLNGPMGRGGCWIRN